MTRVRRMRFSRLKILRCMGVRVDAAGRAWRECLAGLANVEIAGEGQWEAADASKVDDSLWAARGGVGAWTACPSGAAVGAVAWVTRTMQAKYALGGQVGDVAPWSATWKGSGALARGMVLHPPGTARTVTGTGTSVLLGAIPAGKSLYANLHVLSVAGTAVPTLTVRLERDDNTNFTSAATAGTFTAATAIGEQSLSVAGAQTDTYWRAAWTISGTTPSFLFVVSAGIQ